MDSGISNRNYKNAVNLDILVTAQTDIREGVAKRANHVLITGKCNSNCIFCFSEKGLAREHFSLPVISEILQKQFDAGCRILVLSGGEPTIHPDFVKVISNAKAMGYQCIRVITNGRMFAYKKFLKESMAAGLNEATISVHSHLPKVQDCLSGVKGSLEQALRGIKNCISLNLDTKINIVVNKKNIKNLKETIAFFSNAGVKRIGLLRLMPFGQAWQKKDCLFYDHYKNIKYLTEALDFSRQKGIDIWANRFDLELFKDYPEFMQHPFKFVNEVEARINDFRNLTKKGVKLYCYPERCKFCFLSKFCKELNEANKRVMPGRGILEEYKDCLDNDNRLDPMKFAECFIQRYSK